MPRRYLLVFSWFLLLISGLVVSCRDRAGIEYSKPNQCYRVKELTTQLEKLPHSTTKSGILEDAASKEELAQNLDVLDIKDQQLDDLKSRLVAGYREQVQAYRDYAVWVSEGRVVIIDEKDEGKLKEIDERLKNISEKLQSNLKQISAYCETT